LSGKDASFQRAVDDENEAVKIEPAMAYAYYLRGIAYAKLGDNEKASLDTQKAVQLIQSYWSS
jgi:Flp pilus assembly protein TadD